MNVEVLVSCATAELTTMRVEATAQYFIVYCGGNIILFQTLNLSKWRFLTEASSLVTLDLKYVLGDAIYIL